MNFINEEEVTYFMKTSTVEDVEVLMNSIILMKKHIDMDKNLTKKYVVKLFDSPQNDVPAYQVGSNGIGLEAVRRLTKKHKIEDGGSESENSKYFSFYSKDA